MSPKIYVYDWIVWRDEMSGRQSNYRQHVMRSVRLPDDTAPARNDRNANFIKPSMNLCQPIYENKIVNHRRCLRLIELCQCFVEVNECICFFIESNKCSKAVMNWLMQYNHRHLNINTRIISKLLFMKTAKMVTFALNWKFNNHRLVFFTTSFHSRIAFNLVSCSWHCSLKL